MRRWSRCGGRGSDRSGSPAGAEAARARGELGGARHAARLRCEEEGPTADATTRLSVDLWASICASLLQDDGHAAAVAFERVCSTFRAASRQSPAWANALQRWCARACREVLARLRATSFLSLDVWAAGRRSAPCPPTLALTLPSCTALEAREARPLAHLRCLRRLTLGWSRVAAGGAPLAALGANGALESPRSAPSTGWTTRRSRCCSVRASRSPRSAPQPPAAHLRLPRRRGRDAASLRRLRSLRRRRPTSRRSTTPSTPSASARSSSRSSCGAPRSACARCAARCAAPAHAAHAAHRLSCRVTTLDELAAPLAAPLALEECTLHGFHFSDDGARRPPARRRTGAPPPRAPRLPRLPGARARRRRAPFLRLRLQGERRRLGRLRPRRGALSLVVRQLTV